MIEGIGLYKLHFDGHKESKALREIDWWTPIDFGPKLTDIEEKTA
ncbi:MAG: hypothetical protein WBZ36_29660 [Candidatus Nitrosopolaris sp.]